MNPEHQPDKNPYDFIMNSGPVKKRSTLPLPLPAKNNFLFKIGLIVGGVIVFMIITAVVINLFTGSKTNTTDIVALAQTQSEIIRVSDKAASGATSQSIKNFAMNTNLTLQTQQRKTIAYLGKKGATVKAKQLTLKKDAATDTQLQAATQSSTFDSAFLQVMQKLLEGYTTDLQTYFKTASNTEIKTLLQNDYEQAQLLKQQMPSSAVSSQ